MCLRKRFLYIKLCAHTVAVSRRNDRVLFRFFFFPLYLFSSNPLHGLGNFYDDGSVYKKCSLTIIGGRFFFFLGTRVVFIMQHI